jgi:hypothetical protein
MAASQNLGIHRVDQRALSLEMPVKCWLADAEALGQRAGGERVQSRFVQKQKRLIDDTLAVDLHLVAILVAFSPYQR